MSIRVYGCVIAASFAFYSIRVEATPEQFCQGFAKGYIEGWNGNQLDYLFGQARHEAPPIPPCKIEILENDDNSTLSSFEQGEKKGIQRGTKAFKDDVDSGSITDLARKAAQADAAKAAAVKRATDHQAQIAAERAEAARHVKEAKEANDSKAAAATEYQVCEDKVKSARAKEENEYAKMTPEQKNEAKDWKHTSEQVERGCVVMPGAPSGDRYHALLRNKIQNAWIKPPTALSGIDCMVAVTQVPGGEVTSARVTQCNGDAAVRQSIENAVYRASPLPDPPNAALFERNLVIRFNQ